MPTTIRWIDSKHTAILMVHEGDFTADNIVAAIKQVNAMIDTVDHPVNVVQDHRRSGRQIGSIADKLPELARLRHPRNAEPIMVGIRGLMLMLAKFYSRLFRTIRLFDTVEEALEYLGIEDTEKPTTP